MRRPYPRGLGTAISLVLLVAASSPAHAEQTPVQRPAGQNNSVPSPPPAAAPTTVTAPATDESEPPTAIPPSSAGPPGTSTPPPTTASPAEPSPPGNAPAMAPEDPSTPSPPPADADTVAPELLDAEDVDDDPVPPPVIPAQESEETSYDAALARELALLYRPPHNPGRLAVT